MLKKGLKQYEPCSSIHSYKSMNIKYIYTYKSTKTSLAKFDVDFFKQLTGTVPGDVSRRSILLFQALRYRQFLHIAFARDVDIDCGTLVSHEPQT